MNIAICDKKNLLINKDNNILYRRKDKKDVIIGRIISNYNNYLVDEEISLIEFHDKFKKEDYNISQPELYIQCILHENIYTEKRNWFAEHQFPDDDFLSQRTDLILKINNKVIALIENKNIELNTIEKEEKQVKIKYFSQLKKYMYRAVKYNQDKNIKILGSLYIYDGIYLFRNPQILNNIGYYIENNTNFFKTYNFILDPKKDYDGNDEKSMIQMENKYKGMIDYISVDQYIEWGPEGYKTTLIYTSPTELKKINKLSNPRVEYIFDTIKLSNNILDNILHLIDLNKKDFFYKSSDYTNQKHITTIGGYFTLDNKNNKIVYGTGLSLSNGQHSSSAYYYIESIFKIINTSNNKEEIKNLIFNEYNLNDDDKSIFNNIIDKLIGKCNKIKENLSNQQMKGLIEEGFKIQSKLIDAKTKKDSIDFAVASNYTVGVVDTSIVNYQNLIFRINSDLFNDLDLLENKINLQFNYPRIKQIKDHHYIDYLNIFHIADFDTSKFLRVLRQKGINKSKKEKFENSIFIKNLEKKDDIKEIVCKYAKDIKEKFEYFKEYKKEKEDIENIQNAKIAQLVKQKKDSGMSDKEFYKKTSIIYDETALENKKIEKQYKKWKSEPVINFEHINSIIQKLEPKNEDEDDENYIYENNIDKNKIDALMDLNNDLTKLKNEIYIAKNFNFEIKEEEYKKLYKNIKIFATFMNKSQNNIQLSKLSYFIYFNAIKKITEKEIDILERSFEFAEGYIKDTNTDRYNAIIKNTLFDKTNYSEQIEIILIEGVIEQENLNFILDKIYNKVKEIMNNSNK